MDIKHKSDNNSSEQTKERLLKSGLNLLAKKGYRGAVTRDIASDAGVTEMTLFRHYGSKDGLLAAAIAQLSQQLLLIIPKPSGDLEADLLLLSHNLVEQMSSTLFMQLMRVFPALEEQSEPKEQFDQMKALFKTRFLSLMNHYSVGNDCVEYTDDMLFFTFFGPIFLYILDMTDTNSSSTFNNKQHIRFFMRGLCVQVK